jgi:hypothetical protein
MGIQSLDSRFHVKEKRLFYYLADESNSRNIGDICKALHTTPKTLLMTNHTMQQKIDAYYKEYVAWCVSLGIEP